MLGQSEFSTVGVYRMMTYVVAYGETELELEDAVNEILHDAGQEVKFLGGVVVCESEGTYMQAMLVYKQEASYTEPPIEAPKSAEEIAQEPQPLTFGF